MKRTHLIKDCYPKYKKYVHFGVHPLGVTSMSVFIYLFILHVDVQLFQYHLFKRVFMFDCLIFAPLSKISQLSLCRSIFGHSVYSIYLFVYSFTNTTLF